MESVKSYYWTTAISPKSEKFGMRQIIFQKHFLVRDFNTYPELLAQHCFSHTSNAI